MWSFKIYDSLAAFGMFGLQEKKYGRQLMKIITK